MNLTGRSLNELRSAVDALRGCTLPGLLLERAREEPATVAVRYKRGGVFREFTWQRYLAEVRATAAGLIELGLVPGERIAIMGDACIEYLLADVAAQFIGAIPCGIYPTSSPDEVAYDLKLVGARVFVAEDQEHLVRLLDGEAKAGGQLVDRIVICDGRTLFLYDDARIQRFADLLRSGQENRARLAEVDRLAVEVTPATSGSIIFTSGTTGFPKAAYRSQAADLVGFGYAFLEMMPELHSRPQRVVSHLPLAHAMQRAMTIYLPLIASVVPHIGEQNQSLTSLMNEVRPTQVMGVPRTWEKIVAHVEMGVEDTGRLARWWFGLGTAIGRRRAGQLWKSGRPFADPFTEFAWRLLWLTALWPALHKLGLTYTRGAVTGGAPLSPRTHETLQAWGIPLRDLFGMTETGGIGTQAGAWPAPTAPIQPVSCCEYWLADDGELCLRSPGAITAYWNDPDASRALFDDVGRIRSGDMAAAHEAGGFRIVDRKKDIIVTSGGKNIAPAAVENALRSSPYISEVIVFGDARKYIAALVEIDFDSVAQWARQNEIAYTGMLSLSQNDRVRRLIGEEIGRLNEQLARVEQVKRFRILPKELIPEDGDTTPTRKIKRAHTFKLFGHLVEEMYAEDGQRSAGSGPER